MIKGPSPVTGALAAAAGEIVRLGTEEGVFPADRSPAQGDALWIGNGAQPDALLTVIEHQGALWIDLLYVRPELRSGGLASALLKRADELARDRKLSGLSLGSVAGNRRMNAFCVKHGFEPTAIIWARKV